MVQIYINWIELNNQVIVRDNEGKYQLDKDKEVLEVYLKYSVKKRFKTLNTINEEIDYLVKNNYYSEEVTRQYSTIIKWVLEKERVRILKCASSRF